MKPKISLLEEIKEVDSGLSNEDFFMQIDYAEMQEHEQCVDKAALNRERAREVLKEIWGLLDLSGIADLFTPKRPEMTTSEYVTDTLGVTTRVRAPIPFTVMTTPLNEPDPKPAPWKSVEVDCREATKISNPPEYLNPDASKPTRIRFVFSFRFKYISQMVQQSFECICSDYFEAQRKFIKHVGSRKMIQDNFTVEEIPVEESV